MALSTRHRWCLSKIIESFSPELEEEDAHRFMREEAHQKFTQFFRGEASNKLFVYFQPAAGHEVALGTEGEEEAKSELFLGEGDSHLQTKKCCYFTRTIPSGKPLDLSKGSEADLLFGELAAAPLAGIEAALACEFAPLFEASAQWGKADEEQRADFLAELDQFVHVLMDSRKSLVGGLELRRPDHRLIENALAAAKGYGHRSQDRPPELVAHYKQLLAEWCRQIEPYVGEPGGGGGGGAGPANGGGGGGGGGAAGEAAPQDQGPRGELEYWRNRMQRLTSITEQLKRQDCKEVFRELSTLGNKSPEYDAVFKLLKRWKAVDVKITEAANEAKDNVKYLFTLERFIEPLYSGTPTSIIDTLPALMNSIKMIHTIARYYNTNERMTALFAKITEQMIKNCKDNITDGDDYGDAKTQLWQKDPPELVRQLELCLKLNEAYQEQYKLTKAKLAQTPKGKQFDFPEMEIFGNFDLFCRRVIKLIDMYSTIDQFNSLSKNKLEGMEGLIEQFETIVKDFRQKRHDLLAYRENKFDRDYVEFNVKISDLEGALQQFINQSFENITSIEHSLKLLRKFQSILQRESLKSDLDSKLNIIFQNYGMELEQVQQLYEKQKHDPPVPRNLPPVAGNITWSRHLLKRIEEPMKEFESNQNVLAGKDAKRIIKMYNKVARTLVAFEYLWYQAWVQSIDNAKAGLQATLIIRHPEDKLLYVNFDQEILQLIREAKCLDRMGVEVPESAKIALFQEEKFKAYYNDLHWALTEYDRVLKKMIPVTSMVLKPHFNDMEYKLRPGMITLTWTSMNIDAYKAHVHAGLRKLEELVANINDIIENRIEKNLKTVSRTLLVDLPENESFTVEDFVGMQEKHIAAQSSLLQGKNVEIQHAVEDLVKIITQYKFDNADGVSEEEVQKLKKHYNHFMYQALLHCAKNSMNALKNRIASRAAAAAKGGAAGEGEEGEEGGGGGASPAPGAGGGGGGGGAAAAGAGGGVQPFFEVDVQLAPPKVVLNPSLDEIQECINKSAQAILRCFKQVIDWHGPPGEPAPPGQARGTFFERITKDIEIVRVALLLTGCIQGIRNTVHAYLNSFGDYNWLWEDDKDEAYKAFMGTGPTLDDYEVKLRGFGRVEAEVGAIPGIHNIGALSLNSENLKLALKHEADGWKTKFSDNLHAQAKKKLEALTEYMRLTTGKLYREVTDLDSLGFMMQLLREVRQRESGIDMEIDPIMNMYQMLEHYLTPGFMEKEEIDQKTVLRGNWKKLIKQAETRADELSRTQASFKRNLIRDIRDFDEDVQRFRNDFVKNGPMVQGVPPMEAVERLKRYLEEFKIRERKYLLYRGGEEIFALPHIEYPDLDRTKKELKLSEQLFDLYTDVIHTIGNWKDVSWFEVAANMEEMTTTMESFALRCKKLPARLRDWDAFKQLRQEVEDFQTVLPLLTELSKESIMDRHWEEVQRITSSEFEIGPDFKLETLLGINMVPHKDDIEEVTEGADKQAKILSQLEEIAEKWAGETFTFQEWKGRAVNVLKATGFVMEELEEAQMNLQTMLTMRHVAPFREEASSELKKLSDTTDTLELWLKVQMMWCSLESVFTGGDIAKQLPMEAKKFAKVDKDWAKIMAKATEQALVVEACANELLRTSLPVMYAELEKCQKSLEGYLEQKRNKFPRFYFVSNPGLLMILSQGSDPLSMNEHYEKVFDAIATVEHDPKDKTLIRKMNSSEGQTEFSSVVKAVGNIEDWLMDLLRKMQVTMKDLCRSAAGSVSDIQADLNQLRGFVDKNIAQFALLGIQLMWTADQQTALESCKTKKNAMKECNNRMLQVLQELSSWCLQDLGAKPNRIKIETLVTIHVHQRDVTNDLTALHKSKRISDANDFEWLKQARFSWRANNTDDVNEDGALVVSITDVDFDYQFEYLGSKERLVITPLTDRCYITLAQALGMYFGGAPAGPAGTGKTETVKDMGRTLGIFVVVTNCTDQQKYTDCAKIFKGLCQGGLWGCFDEFNRIQLPVLSVVAQQVLAIQNAKKTATQYFQFPGDPQNILLKPVCAFFITMNPGYAGRQELPENLKALFRGVAMMVPDFRIIMKVKLCAVGYVNFDLLATKFFILYNTCKEQLSNQKHYDWGLRNILAVLRTGGQTKRDNLDKPEDFLMYRTLRDMNLSKLVAQDVPLFLSLLADLFPSVQAPPKGEYPALEEQLKLKVAENGLVYHLNWVSKVIQLYETTLVRHGIMLVGPSGGGKTKIFRCLRQSLEVVNAITYKDSKLNPKAIRAQEMYGEVDAASGEWTTGVFAAMWAKFNNRNLPYNTWIIADGPVDAIWIEDLNTVLDDNKILTLANGDRMPMTDNVKLMFEVETLVNASPATVSRAGIIYVSDTDLDWAPFVEAWILKQPEAQHEILRALFLKYMGENTPVDVGICMDFLARNTEQVMNVGRVGLVSSMSLIYEGLITRSAGALAGMLEDGLEKLFLYCLCWTVGGLLEFEDRQKLDAWLREKDDRGMMPDCAPETTIYEYFVNPETLEWQMWAPPEWKYPKTEKLDFSNLLVPTMDSTRAQYLIKALHDQRKPTLLVGGEGTAKTSTALMFFSTLDSMTMLVKRVNFSSATTPFMCQNSIETELDKRGGKNFGPPNGKAMTVFIDDMSMPEVNAWGDQPTLEMVRMMVELNGFCFLDKDKRGDFKTCEDLIYVAAMGHPGGGKNDIPNRLKSKFFIFNLVLPSITSINDIYGQMLAGRFTSKDFGGPVLDVVGKLTKTTIELWRTMKAKMLPTPAKFHYVFNMRELSRVFQGILLTPKDTIKGGGVAAAAMGLANQEILVGLWRHECERVFADKLTNNKDKDFYGKTVDKLTAEVFGDQMTDTCKSAEFYMVNFMRDDVYDEDGIMIEEAPKVYEPGGGFDGSIRKRVLQFLHKHNEENPAKQMELVLFNDALKHLLRINRLLEMPRGSALLVGVGGSGKQSLTRLASYISRAMCFQITLTKTYNVASLMEDLRTLYKNAGQLRKQTTFLFTESEIKNEVFLETINSVLMTGEVPGLFAKDEMLAMTADLQSAFKKERPGMEETQDNLKQFFTDCVRDNLHLVLCMSPLNPKFPIRARKFPGLISGPTIDWFLSWPEEALVSVSKGFISDYPIECPKETKNNLMVHMGLVHNMVTQVCEEYFAKMRRRVYQTPKSYLSFIKLFKNQYKEKLAELKLKEERVTLGLQKLIQGAEDVEAMKIVLADEQVKLDVATKETNEMLKDLEKNSAEAKKEGDQVAEIAAKCEADAARIAEEKRACEADLAKAQPFVDEAEVAISSIKPAHIGEIKKLPNPSPIIQLVFDGCLILFMQPMAQVKPEKHVVNKQEINFLATSFKPFGLSMLSDPRFLANVFEFGKVGKDKINEETIELLCPYIDLEGFQPAVAKNASQAAEGLCVWVRAMKFYHEASKIVKPKLEALAIAEAQMEAANKALSAAEDRLKACKDRLAQLQDMFDNQMAEKKRIEDGALALQRKMNQASELIGGLAGERERWTDDANNFADLKRRLVGDCAVGCAFISYCGPFNQEYRASMVNEKFIVDLKQKEVPVTSNLDVINFLVDVGTIGDWNMEGLPTDPLSIQNGILVTRSSRYPLLIDPQGQALSWIKSREAERMPNYGPVALNDSKLRDKLEFCMGDGRSMMIIGVEEEIDPMLDPLLEKEFIIKGSRISIVISDKNMDFDSNFKVFFITRLPNPNFSPELQAKVTVVDFTVTQKGLEEQLLGKVIGKEQKALEEQLSQVLEDVNSNTKALLALDASLLERLTSNTGNLLEDEELIGVLANTKAKAAEVNTKLKAAAETKESINEKREQFRPVATRGSVLYFSIVESSYMNCMYQTSLDQFLLLFMDSMDQAEKATLASKRVANIIETMTYITYRYVNRGLYEKDKLTYVLLLTLKVLVTAGLLKQSDVTLFLRGGAALDIAQERRKPNWIDNDPWLNVIELSRGCKFFANLPTDITANEAMWRRWYDDNEPENMAIPDYENKLNELSADIGPFYRLLLVRSLRVDRCILQCKEFIRACQQMGPTYVEPVTDTIDEIYSEMVPEVPVIFLLSVGADPTESIEQLARKRKLPPPATISLGEGQEPVAIKAMNAAAANGTWVLLQNCELGLGLMDMMEDLMAKLMESVDPGFRLFITALPNDQFPLGLLQMSTKVTNEPPAGLKAGLLRSYTVIVDQERLERVETAQWRQLVFGLCFLHSVVQERRKFGALGWCIPYEYNTGDLTACILFLEKHLYNGPISWPTFQYMVAEAQYGGKITDDLDRRMFKTYTEVWLTANACSESFNYNPSSPIYRIPNDFVYRIPQSEQHADYRTYLSSFPEIDSPEIFGLHPNADLTFRKKEVNSLFDTLGETQPKGGGGDGGVSREDVVSQKCEELEERLPEDYNEDDYKVKINKLGGLAVPLNIFLFQEIQRLQRVIGKVRFILAQLRLAINGEVVMTEELQGSLDSMFDARVPHFWIYTVAGDEFSWILPGLGVWFSSLLARDKQDRGWLEGGRPNSYWLTGFFNPQGMLTAMKQEMTRKNKANKWALDDVTYHTEVTQYMHEEQVRSPPQNGVYVHGLYLDGGAWSKQEGTLVESAPKTLFIDLPVLWVSANTISEQNKTNQEMFGSIGPYRAPCYKYPSRTDRYLIFMVNLKCTTERNPKYWILRGVALLCNTD